MGQDQEDKTVIANVSHMLSQPIKKKGVPSLVQYSGANLGKRYTLQDPEVRIGRSPEAQITIAEASVSRFHARLFQTDQGMMLEDLFSANGTYINDTKVSAGPILLKDQDMIRLGAILIKFFSSENIDGFIQDKIYQMATIDVGTQIYNKQYLLESLDTEFKISQSSGRPLSVIYYDLDFFKKVNDTYGHNAGDVILKESAALVKKTIRKDDIQCRYGGEEFVILLPNTTIGPAFELAERIRMALETQDFLLVLEDQGIKKTITHKQTVSMGVSERDSHMSTPKDLLESADKKLYHSKQTGRNKVTS
jgi:two-component system cell cycle response regulator